MIVVAVIVGLILGFFHILTLYILIGEIKRRIVCTEIIDAKVTSVDEECKRYKDSKTGKIKYRYSYTVYFEYDYNGQNYESSHRFSNRCRYSEGQETEIKINPHNPTESLVKGKLKDFLGLFFIIPVFVIFDFFYMVFFFQ